ncbi:Putative septation protein SpoVG [Anatilimnocola aggregata]|uniref:Septation protein SpoVG n=1 Tax=Anatilimnocola aggregata TaxID=2528021 RepID=A0A517YIY4_9BACT|nr:SpoVG family protein [Anatilimnocola aggregata]QDU30186.1 Putative septation protein SpoVG [Anatilimnocola aggregata]
MEITEVRVKLMEDSDDRLQGFCSITFDNCFVVRDLKIIEGSSGPFVAMPSRKLTSHCPQCGCKNHLKAAHCNQCGSRLKEDRTVRDQEGRTKLYADIAHPINSSCREMIQNRVIAEYRAELDRAKQPGYVSKYDDDYDDDVDAADLTPPTAGESRRPNLPPGTQIQPAESEIRAPHMLPAPAPPPSGPQTPHSGLAKEKREQSDKPKPKNGGFGEGIF